MIKNESRLSNSACCSPCSRAPMRSQLFILGDGYVTREEQPTCWWAPLPPSSAPPQEQAAPPTPHHYIHTHTNACINTHTHAHTRAQTHMHTHTCIHTCTLSCSACCSSCSRLPMKSLTCRPWSRMPRMMGWSCGRARARVRSSC